MFKDIKGSFFQFGILKELYFMFVDKLWYFLERCKLRTRSEEIRQSQQYPINKSGYLNNYYVRKRDRWLLNILVLQLMWCFGVKAKIKTAIIIDPIMPK